MSLNITKISTNSSFIYLGIFFALGSFSCSNIKREDQRSSSRNQAQSSQNTSEKEVHDDVLAPSFSDEALSLIEEYNGLHERFHNMANQLGDQLREKEVTAKDLTGLAQKELPQFGLSAIQWLDKVDDFAQKHKLPLKQPHQIKEIIKKLTKDLKTPRDLPHILQILHHLKNLIGLQKDLISKLKDLADDEQLNESHKKDEQIADEPTREIIEPWDYLNPRHCQKRPGHRPNVEKAIFLNSSANNNKQNESGANKDQDNQNPDKKPQPYEPGPHCPQWSRDLFQCLTQDLPCPKPTVVLCADTPQDDSLMADFCKDMKEKGLPEDCAGAVFCPGTPLEQIIKQPVVPL